jgi:serine/threonine-protein kinase
MPFLEGALPLDEYAARRNLDLRQRLALFHGVCEAVQHAHQNLVVHSDLKPANILVDDDGVIQLVDFGIARLLDAGSRGQTTLIEGQRPLTPQFASPEQIKGQSPSTLSDVYSLGVVLYGLITDHAPYEFGNSGLSEVAAKLATTDPLPPSRHHSAVPADLDNVVLKAMAREPERRYLSAGALAEDLRRWLAGEPVQARAATLSYQLGKFVRRHRWPVATAALGLLALVGLALVLLVSNRQISAQAELLRAEKERAEATALFWSDLFEQTDPVHADQAALSTTELLDRAVAQLAENQRLGRQNRARLLSVISTAYWNQGDNSKAMDAAQQAVALYDDDDPPSEEMGIAYKQLANIGNALADFDLARSAAEKSIAVLDQLPDISPAVRAHSLDALALVLTEQGEMEAATEVFEAALALQAQVDQPGIDVERATAMGNLGYTYFRMSAAGGPKAAFYESRAADLVDQASTLLLKELGPDHPRVSFMLNAAGVLSRARGDYDQAQDYFMQASEIAARGLPPEHDFHYVLRYNQGQVMLLQGEAPVAGRLFADNYAKAAAHLPLGHPERLSLAQGLGQAAAALDNRELLQQVLNSLREELQAPEVANPAMRMWLEAFEITLLDGTATGERLDELERAAQESGDRQLIAYVAELGQSNHSE